MLDYGKLAQNPYHLNRYEGGGGGGGFDFWSLLPMVGGMMSANQAGDYQEIDINELKGHMSPWAEALGWDEASGDWSGGGLYGKSQDFMEMGSDYNVGMRKNIMGQSQDSSAANMMQMERLMGSGNSGILQQQALASGNKATQQGQQNFLNQFQSQQGLGANLLSQATSGMERYSENIANAYINNVNTQNAMNQAQYSGLAQGLLSFVPGMNGWTT